MESIYIRRDVEKLNIILIESYLDTHPVGTENITCYHYKTRLDLLETSFNSFNQYHNDLADYIQYDNANEIQEYNNYFNNIEELFLDLQFQLREIISVLNLSVSLTQTSDVLGDLLESELQSSINLNSVESNQLSYAGEYRDWSAFFEKVSSNLINTVHLRSYTSIICTVHSGGHNAHQCSCNSSSSATVLNICTLLLNESFSVQKVPGLRETINSDDDTFNIYSQSENMLTQPSILFLQKSIKISKKNSQRIESYLRINFHLRNPQVSSTVLANWKQGGMKLIIADIASLETSLLHLCLSSPGVHQLIIHHFFY